MYPARHRLDLPLWKTQWGACPGVAGAAGVSDTRRGACPVGRLPTLPLPSFLPPIPPSPFPGGEGGAPKFISPGASPPAPLHLTACGTYRTCQAGTRSGALPLARRGCGGVPIPCEGAPSASPVRRKTDRTAILLAVPPAKERGDRGRWNYPSQATAAFEMVLSPGAGAASAAGGKPPIAFSTAAGIASAAGGKPPAGHHSGWDSRLRQELCEIRPAIITDSEIPLAIITEMW